MSAIVKSAIEAGLADLEATTTVPDPPFGYGSDLWCEADLHERMEEVSDTALVLAQYAVRRLDTPSGLPDDGDWGMSLASYCNRGMTPRELSLLGSEVEAELADDDRIGFVTVEVTSAVDWKSLSVKIRIVPVDDDEGFELILSVSPIEVLIEELSV
jgi:hypothetical protein